MMIQSGQILLMNRVKLILNLLMCKPHVISCQFWCYKRKYSANCRLHSITNVRGIVKLVGLSGGVGGGGQRPRIGEVAQTFGFTSLAGRSKGW